LPYEGHLFAGGIAHPKIQGRKSKQKNRQRFDEQQQKK